MNVQEIIKVLCNVSEKAAGIARLIRKDEKLLEWLVEEKSEDQANPRFVQDFKTLADVLIQEMIRKEVGGRYPDILPNIRGEEDSTFTNSAGEKVTVKVYDSMEETFSCLEQVLNGRSTEARLLAEEVHRDVEADVEVEELHVDNLDLAKTGIWVDPIDATAEYVKGGHKESRFPNIASGGLSCVTILIGMYDLDSGVPLAGVINQPFATAGEDGSYQSDIFWGVCMGNTRSSNIKSVSSERPKIAILSSSEQTKFTKFLKQKLRYEIVYSAGAGYKLMKIVKGDADINLLSRGTSFKWDVCAPQAILQALGGDVLNLNDTIFAGKPVPIGYGSKEPNCNINGILVYREEKIINEIVAMFSGK